MPIQDDDIDSLGRTHAWALFANRVGLTAFCTPSTVSQQTRASSQLCKPAQPKPKPRFCRGDGGRPEQEYLRCPYSTLGTAMTKKMMYKMTNATSFITVTE